MKGLPNDERERRRGAVFMGSPLLGSQDAQERAFKTREAPGSRLRKVAFLAGDC